MVSSPPTSPTTLPSAVNSAPLEQNLPTSDRGQLRLAMAQECLASKDPFLREAGTQLLAGNTDALSLALLEKASTSFENRVQDGAIRALFQSAATGSLEAEAIVIKVLSGFSVAAQKLRQGDKTLFGSLDASSFDARRFRFLAGNPQLAQSRLITLKNGSHQRVQAFRSQRLRANPAFLAFFDVLRSDPDLTGGLLPVLRRRGEFVLQNGQPTTLEPFHNTTRRMTGLLAAIGTNDRLAALAGVMVDRSVRQETKAFWQMLKTEIPYVPEVVVGSGPHAANFCATLATLRPSIVPLVLEQRKRIGGTFADPGGEAWRMNSRARPPAADRTAEPGGRGALNTLGPYAPIQESDLTGDSYATQERIALATRLSLLLSCHAITETTITQRLQNNEETRATLKLKGESLKGAKGRYLLRLQNGETGETGYISTNCLVYAGGLGEPKVAFPDRPSQKAIDGEKAKGGNGLYLSFFDFMARMGQESNVFPLRGLKTVVVVGAGDSARVAVEALLGYGPTSRRSVHSLDRVEQVIWIGQPSATREAFLQCERSRYHLLAGEFPKQGENVGTNGGITGSARIRAVSEKGAAFRMEGKQAVVVTTGGTRFVGDAVIDCSGFQREGRGTPQLLANKKFLARSGSRIRVCDADGDNHVLLSVQSVLPLDGDTSRKKVEGMAQRTIGRTPIGIGLPFSTDYRTARDLGADVEQAAKGVLGLPDAMRFYLPNSVLPQVFSMTGGKREAIARQEPEYENIYYIGPQAGLPMKKGEGTKGSEQPATTVPGVENQVALWRYGPSVTAFGEYYFASLLSQRENTPLFDPARRARELPQIEDGSSETAIALVEGNGETVENDSRHLLQLALYEHLRGFRLPEGGVTKQEQTVTLSLVPMVLAGKKQLLVEVKEARRLLRGVSLLPLLDALAEDVLVQQAVFAQGGSRLRLNQEGGRGSVVEAVVQVRRGKLRLMRIVRE